MRTNDIHMISIDMLSVILAQIQPKEVMLEVTTQGLYLAFKGQIRQVQGSIGIVTKEVEVELRQKHTGHNIQLTYTEGQCRIVLLHCYRLVFAAEQTKVEELLQQRAACQGTCLENNKVVTNRRRLRAKQHKQQQIERIVYVHNNNIVATVAMVFEHMPEVTYANDFVQVIMHPRYAQSRSQDRMKALSQYFTNAAARLTVVDEPYQCVEGSQAIKCFFKNADIQCRIYHHADGLVGIPIVYNQGLDQCEITYTGRMKMTITNEALEAFEALNAWSCIASSELSVNEDEDSCHLYRGTLTSTYTY